MAKLQWAPYLTPDLHFGVEKVVLYAPGRFGVEWPGIQNISVKPTVSSIRTAYLEGVKTVHLSKTEECTGSIDAFFSPPEFDRCDGTLIYEDVTLGQHEPREPFSLAFCSRTTKGVRLHILYNAWVTPTSRTYQTVADIEPNVLSWEFETKSIDLYGYHPTALITIDLGVSAPAPTKELLRILYGSEAEEPRCPLPDEVLTIFGVFDALRVIDHGDGSFSVIGSDAAVALLGDGEFQLNASVVEMLEEGSYQIHYTPM